ncbi:MAG TPA: hemolysin III family protein [Luteibacter sp.]|uniref:PAQR family membrane homeostasis protein TrhA n=1 Tax=Luteibacter sp. TaxID=1886636 RepID=UPI002B854B7C|nr:hemolysin III family protein [Luteibacter sp.]HVI53733.1 hemolysin III family protein [Luteibacter sp.]
MATDPDLASVPYARIDELGSCIVHGLAVGLSVAGLVALVAKATSYGGPLAVFASALYGATLIFLFTASTLYHTLKNHRAQSFLRTLDHVGIYWLIAGTYTPFALIAMPETWGFVLFGAIWLLAIAGTVLELGILRRYHHAAVFLYVAMGWGAIATFQPLAGHVPKDGLMLLVAGGVAYTAGVPFYLAKRLPFHHSLWHLFVLAGSVLHYFAVLFYVLPGAGAGRG